jgi:hypothetical protein
MTHALQNAVARQFFLKLAAGVLGIPDLSETSAQEDAFVPP